MRVSPSVWTKYIAEPVNTLTNLMFMGAALYGMWRVYQQRLPSRFIGGFAGLGLVGCGSFLFHMTLKHEAQLLDELPMIWASSYVSWSLLDQTLAYGKKVNPVVLPTVIFAIVTFISVTYVQNGNPVFHQVAYALIFGLTIIHGIHTLFSSKSPLAMSESSRRLRSNARRLQFFGTVTFLLGFLIWNIDNIFCGTLRVGRDIVGYPWALLLEGHGWWHILTCYGAYMLFVSMETIVLPLMEHPDNFVVVMDIFPYVKRVQNDDPKRRLLNEYLAAKNK